MSGHSSWRQLPVAAPGIPTLLVSTAFTAESYSVHLSDLANVWVESLDRRAIIKRGLVEDTSIDPSDGPDQIRKLLELLRAAFDASDPEHPNTSLTLARGDDGDSLVVHVTCLLPKPLKPLKWPMPLKKCPQSTLATELVLPLTQAHEARTREIDQLISALREKDGVITRLVDKLEAAGIGLEHVFNSLSGKRKVTRAAAEGRVKGLAPFTEAEFRSQSAELRPIGQASDVSSLIGAVFGGPGLRYKSDLDLEASTALNDWWMKLAKGKTVILSRHQEKKDTETPPPPRDPGTSKDEDDDDFQVQATPPGVPPPRKRRSPAAQEAMDDEETSDGEDSTEGSTPSPPPSRTATEAKTTGSKLGAIGRHTKPSTPPPPENRPQKATSRPPAPADDDSETASEADEREPDRSPSPPPARPPRRGGLGRIGGKPKEDSPATDSTRSPSPEVTTEQASTLPRRQKLGMIGKTRPGPVPDAPGAGESDDARGRRKTPAAESKHEQRRETSQERADRKRAELQKDLERRAAAGPAKKKRKF